MSTDICACIIWCIVICMFIEFTLYTKAFVLDIKTVFTQMDRLAWAKGPEKVMLMRCKEALDLHERVNR